MGLPTPGEGGPAEEVRESAEDFLSFVRSNPDWPRLYFEFVVYAARNPEFREELATRNRAMRERIGEVIRGQPTSPPSRLSHTRTLR